MNPNQPNNPYIVSSSPIWQDFNNATNTLNNLVGQPDPYAQLFQNQLQENALTADNAIASATAATERQKVNMEQRQKQLVAGLNTAAEKTGLASNSAYQMQVIEGAQNRFRTQAALLDQTEKLAIARAKAAQMSGDVAVLKEQLAYINDIRKQKADALYKENQLAWEKEKFNRQMSLAWASENRLANKVADTGQKFTPDQLKKLEQAGIDPANRPVALNFLYGENKGELPKTFKEKYSTGQIWNLALALGIPRNVNLSKKDEVDAFLVKLPDLIAAYKAAGKTDKEINDYFESLM